MPREIEITLDKPRKLKFRFRDIDELCRRLGGLTITELVARAVGGDTQFAIWGLVCGLRHQDSKMTSTKAQDLIEAHLSKDEDSSLNDIFVLLDQALTQSGMFGKQVEENGASASGEEEKPEPSG